MTRGRKKHAVPCTDWVLSIPVDIANKIDLILHDPVTGKTQYGARSKLVQSLLHQWLETQRTALTPNTESVSIANDSPSTQPTESQP